MATGCCGGRKVVTVAQRTCLGQRAGHEDRTGAGVAPEAACTWGRLAERAVAREAEPISKTSKGQRTRE